MMPKRSLKKLRLSLSILILLLDCSFVEAQWFGLFGPKDYEECASNAAKDAKNSASLSILIQNCAKEFPARRNGRGGYVYYESISNSYIDVRGPKLTERDWQKVEEVQKQALDKALREAEEERLRAEELLKTYEKEEKNRKKRNREALNSLSITGKKLVQGEYLCMDTKLSVFLKNNSKEHITRVTIGFSYFGPEQTYCPDSLPDLPAQKISLKPSESGVINIDGYQLCDRNKSTKYCIRVNSVAISER